MEYQSIIGLEVHVELNTRSKMFCSCPNNPDEKHPNTNICPICTAQPGTLPVTNKEAVKKVIKTGLALNCHIPEQSKFSRKNYFYPDLPKGYQISQYDRPLCGEGYLKIDSRKIRIRRIHLEEDTGRLLHPEGKNYSLVDFNRTGIPLMELVTEPDLKSGKEARRFAEELQIILRYLGVSDADMEKGQMRVEVNISLSKDKKLGTKVEIKNLNSFRSVEKSINYEIKRQTELLEKKEIIVQETRGWNDVKEITISQRKKEEAHDYRYFPEPDLPTLILSDDYINKIKSEIPELPQQKRERFIREYNLNEKNIDIFIFNKGLSEYFEKVSGKFKTEFYSKDFQFLVKIIANYIITDLMGLFKGTLFSEKNCLITPENFAEFITLISKKEISSKIAKQVLLEMFQTGANPSHIIKEKGLAQMTDEIQIEKVIQEVLSKNPKAVGDYKKGKESSFQFLIGQVMAMTQGKANPELIHKILKKQLK